jgi:hypothetical protein
LFGRKVGPTERIGLSPPEEAVVDVAGVSAGAGAVAAAAGGAPFFEAGPFAGCCARCCIFFALSSVTMMSPCCSAAALSSIVFSASDQVCPGALQAQDGLNSVRKWNAFGSAL